MKKIFAAYRDFFKRGYSDWEGVSSRPEYWWVVLINCLIIFLWGALYYGIFSSVTTASGGLVALFMFMIAAMIVFGLVTFVPELSLTVRRLRDAGLSLWWLVLVPMTFMPYIGNIAGLLLIVLLIFPTKAKPVVANNKSVKSIKSQLKPVTRSKVKKQAPKKRVSRK